MTRTSFATRLLTMAGVAVVAVASTSCGDVARTGRAPVSLMIEDVEAASGATPSEFGSLLYSDVQTLVNQSVGGQQVKVPTIYSDVGRATFRIISKNPGTSTSPLAPSTLNAVTLTRYRVRYLRTDGRNTPGVDVPYGFDGGLTVTVGGDGAEGGFELVRHAAKTEPPLRNLIGNGGAQFIMTIAEVTFYGADQAGNEVTATAMITVNFGDWGDPT
jgi:hypothetical protein